MNAAVPGKGYTLKKAVPETEASPRHALSETERDRILSAVDATFDSQVGFLLDLVRCASLRGQESKVQQLVETALLERGYEVERQMIDQALIGRHPAFSPATVS
jgi:acetylornithine deacetylase